MKEARRLRSAFDVFDFVNNAISSGVKEAKHTQKDVLGKALIDASKVIGPVAKDVNKVIRENQSEIKKAEKEIENIIKQID